MDFVQLLVQYGTLAGAAVLLLGVALLVAIFRRGGGRPRGVLGWIGTVVTVPVVGFSVLFLWWAAGKLGPLQSAFRHAGAPAPALAFTGADDGERHTLAEYRGRVVVLNLWATWCGPCRAELPGLDRLQREYGREGLVVVALSDEPLEQQAKLPGWENLQVVRGVVDGATADPALYVPGQVARPVTHLIGRDGVLSRTLVGEAPYERFVELVRPLLRAHV
jgi:thiol-disulfide isomerase/thioredoxin